MRILIIITRAQSVCRRSWICLFLGLIGLTPGTNALAVEKLDIQLWDGTSLTVNVEPQVLLWTNVLDDGQMTKERFQLADVNRLWISSEPASNQVAQVRQLLSQLESPDYYERDSAEKQLSTPEIGSPYQYLIELQQDHPSFEVRYRVNRILGELPSANSHGVKPTKFDRLELKNGKILDGDIGDFQLKFTYAGREEEFGREQLFALGSEKMHERPNDNSDPVNVDVVHNFKDGFYSPPQTTVTFEVDPDGDELKRNVDVSEVFAKQGIKFSTTTSGFIGISGYEFKFTPEKPAFGNSICVFETTSNYPKRFKGVLEVRFCMPGESQTAAGVNEFGLTLARVNHNRDFLMEAYSADGHLLACVEAADEPCVFFGVKSNEPIACIKVLSNPYLHRVSRKVDEDYAVDDVCFSAPKPIAIGNSNGVLLARLRNGDLFIADKIEFADDAIKLETSSFDNPFEFPITDVAEIRLANELSNTSTDWLAMLPDRSVVRFNPDKNNSVVSFSGARIEPSEIVGMTMTQNKFRFPATGDFDSGKIVLVFPTCRIAANSANLGTNSLEWDPNATKIIQPIYTTTDPADDDDPTPQANRVELAKAIPSDVPTIWYSQPHARESKTGILQLTDGQQFVLGSQQEFQITGVKKTGVTVGWRNRTVNIPWNEIRSLQFPVD